MLKQPWIGAMINTVDERNPTPPDMNEALYLMGIYLTYQIDASGFLPSTVRISSIFQPRHGKYGNPVGELLTRSKQGSQLYYEVQPNPLGWDGPTDGPL